MFIVICSAMILQKTDLTKEVMTEHAYDWILVCSFIVMVPIAFVITVIAKLRHVRYVLGHTDNAQRNAFDRCIVGLETEEDVKTLQIYLNAMRVEVASADFAQILDGTKWAAKNRDQALVRTAEADAATDDDDDDDEPTMGAVVKNGETLLPSKAHHAKEQQQTREEEQFIDNYYDKFTGGFEGTFADMSDYFGGLEKMIGDCRKDLMKAMEEEHCEVAEGYGASDVSFVTSSYRVTATPREEWHFVTAPAVVGDMDAGVDRDTGRSRGYRVKVPVEQLFADAAELITKSFAARGFTTIVTNDDIYRVELRIEEIVALRLYTGPMFEIYNGLLRAYGNTPRGIMPSYALVGAGQDVRGRFTTTLHVLNSGVLKIAKLQVRQRVLY
eukprot:COSAG02_NODE_1754_length_11053_cov_1.832390_4_plen_385_part_00